MLFSVITLIYYTMIKLRVHRFFAKVILGWCLGTVTVFSEPVEIVLWHSMAGSLGLHVQELVARFNRSQSDCVIKPIYKGDYISSLTSFAAAFQAKHPPAIIQVSEVGTATMLSPTGIIRPVEAVLQEQGLSLALGDFFPALRAYYSAQGQLMAMPFNTSVPVMYYNADALTRLGYTEDTFPKTWEDLGVLAQQLRKAGFACAYTSAYPAWVLVESYSAIHRAPMVNADSGKATFNNASVVRHLERLARWQQAHWFEYGGRSDDAVILFLSGRCPLFTQSSGAYNGLSKTVTFRLGVAPVPVERESLQSRADNLAGGGALWIVAGHPPQYYTGIALFIAYLAQPEVQQWWHERTGYLPLGLEGTYASLRQGKVHPVLTIAQKEFKGRSAALPVARIGAQNQIRAIMDEALEFIFSGIKSPQRAMDDAVRRADHTLLRFRQNTSS